jgi:hypothetical protein
MDDIRHGATLFKSGQEWSSKLNKANALRRVPVKINRNLMNFPLARDARAKVEWFQGSKTGRWMAYLPGEGRKTHRIRLIVPANARARMRRCPSALDMNVLFQLLAEAQRPVKTKQIEFASSAVLLRRLGLAERSRERARVKASLLYWTRTSIRWPRWYRTGGQHIRLTLPPPIEDAKRDSNCITIRLHRDWCELAQAKGYYMWLPLPLPPQAAVQNLVLLILTQKLTGGDPRAESNELLVAHPDLYFDAMAALTRSLDRWWVARKMGLLHKQRNKVLNRAVDQAAGWFAVHGGKLKLVTAADDDDIPSVQIAFRYARPRVPRRKSSMGRSRGPQWASGRKSAWSRGPNVSHQDEELTQDEAEYFAMIEKKARGKW